MVPTRHPAAAAAFPRSAVWCFADADAYPPPFAGALAGADYNRDCIRFAPLDRNSNQGFQSRQPGRGALRRYARYLPRWLDHPPSKEKEDTWPLPIPATSLT
jgi:hypothetical protein